MNTRNLILGLGILLMGVLPARALVVVYIDPGTKKEMEVRTSTMEAAESPEGITVNKGLLFEISYTKVGMTMRRDTKAVPKPMLPLKISPAAVKDYQLTETEVAPLPFLLEYRPPLALVERAALPATKDADRVKLMEDSLPKFTELKPKLKEGSLAKRHVEFKHAETLYRLSSIDARHRQPAMAALMEYQKQNGTGWQIVPALTMLAQLQEDAGDLDAVQKTYLALGNTPGLLPEVRVSSLIGAARALMKLEKFGEARTQLNALKAALEAADPLSGKVELYIAQCQLLGDNATEAQQAEQKVRAFLTSTDDKSLKALAHNTLGDYFTKLKRDEDAFWEYLRVDTLFNEDKFEQARAMYHLIRLFRDVKKDPDRATQYEETLTKDPRFAGLEYQKKALKK